MEFMNDPPCWKRDRTQEIAINANVRQDSAKFVQKLFAESSPDLKRQDIMYMRALQKSEKKGNCLHILVLLYDFRSVHQGEAAKILNK